MKFYDNVLPEHERKLVHDYLQQPGWVWGWKARRNIDTYSFWHKHFAGTKGTDHPGKDQEKPYDCAEELSKTSPLLFAFWGLLNKKLLVDHKLVRCYANAYPYGSEGTLHTDSVSENSFTALYFPHERWSPNWGGETVFFDKEETNLTWASYPRPNRLLIFNGTTPHAARGITRICPLLRITLMFKTEHNPAPEKEGTE